MTRENRYWSWLLSIILIIGISLMQFNIARADDGTTPPPPTEEPVDQPPADPAGSAVEVTPILEDASAITGEVPTVELYNELPENTDIVILDENGATIPLATEEAAAILEEADPIWCPASQLIPTPGSNGCTSNQTITGLLTLMRNNPTNFDENGIIYLEKPGGAGFTTPLTLDNSATGLGGSYNTLRNFNLTIRGGWNGNNPGTFSGDTNFGVSGANQGYIKIGTSAANPWIGNIILQDITLNDITNASNPSLAVYTSTGSVTLNDVDVDNADNSESVRITTGSGNITISDSEVTSGDDNYGFNLTTTSGSITLTNVLVDNHTDGDGINITGGNGTVTLNNADVRNGSNGDGINIFTTGGTVNLNGVDVDGADGGNGLNVATTSGNINLNDTDVQNQQDGRTANLSSQSGSINVTNNSDFEGDNTNQGFFASTLTGSITITGTSGNRIEFYDASGPGTGTNYNGATLSAPNVSLAYVTSNDNDGSGILITNANTVTLNNVIADNNGTNPSGVNNAIGSGVTVIGTGGTIVNVTGGGFSDNERYGIEVINGSLNFVTLPSFGINGLGDYFPGGSDTTGPVITPNVFCSNWGNGGWCRGLVIVTWSVTDPDTFVSSRSGCNASFVFSNTPYTGTTFTCTATSADGTLTSSVSVTVYRDATQPNLTLPANMTVEATSPAGAVVNYTATATDSVDPSVVPVCAPPSGSTFALGTTTVNCTATDDAGNSRSGSFTITVRDTTPPTLNLPGNLTLEATGPSGAVVTYSASATDLVDGLRPVSCSPASGGTFPFGTTTVNCSASDTRGNTASGSFTITVQDTTPPALTLPASVIVEATGPGGAVATYTASAIDLVDGPRPVSCSPASGGAFPLGTTPVICTSSDTRGNTSTGSFNIVVRDTTPPTIDPVTDITRITYMDSGRVVPYTYPSTSDIVDGPGVATCNPPSGHRFPVGANVVTCTATDSNGNTATLTFTIQVNYIKPLIAATYASGFVIPVTGGEIFGLDCFTVAEAFDVKITFYNLCGHQAVIGGIESNALPGELPDGYSLLQGLDVTVLSQGQSVNPLPDLSGIQMDFPVPANSNAKYAVLYWSDEDGDGNGEWIEISEPLSDTEISKALSSDGETELYHITVTQAGLEKILTTEFTGIFVLVQK